MKFEKRAAAGETPDTAPETDSSSGSGKKPVIIYIMILFLAAFVLMFLSLLAHQRSNTEALGELQNSVAAMQAAQEQIIDLQTQLDETEQERDQAKTELEASQNDAEQLKKESDALMALYTLQQEYLAGNLDSCRITLQEISDQKLAELLPTTAPEGVTTPAQRYQELKEAILNQN